MKLLIPSATGIEAVVKRQLADLGYHDTRAIYGRIAVPDCAWRDVARLNMFLRSGERVLINLAQFEAKDFDALYDGIRSVCWSDWISKQGRIVVVTKSVRSLLSAHHSIQSVGKKAIADVLLGRYSELNEEGEEYRVELDITDDVCSVNLDTTGEGLHKRGYRTLPYDAPLKETTAAALIDLSVWNPDKMFSDIFCGSGTLPIEAAMKALHMAPGMHRRFAYEDWQCVAPDAHAVALEEARDARVERRLNIIGADVSERAIETARFHAMQAGVDGYIKFNVRRAQEFVTKSSYGVNISNPPYGERLGDLQTAIATASDMGKLYRTLDKWNFYFLTPLADFERHFGRRADKKRYIYNAGIKCSYYSFNGPKPTVKRL